MKNYIKGVIAGIIIGAAVCSVHAMAADIVGEAVYTDIKLNLNGVVIPCYNVDDYVVITAEDLGHYGFDVNWSDTDRKLYISRNPEYTKMSETEYADKTGEVGAHYADIYSTDIEVEFNGKRVNSYSVNGEMLIKPEEALVADGITFDYNDDERMLYMRVDGLEEATVYPLAENLVGYKTADTIWVEDNGKVIIREHAYDYENYKDVYASYIEDHGKEYVCIIDRQSGVSYDGITDDRYYSHIYPRTDPENMSSVPDIVTSVIDNCFVGEHYYWGSYVANGESRNGPVITTTFFDSGERELHYAETTIVKGDILCVGGIIYDNETNIWKHQSVLFIEGKRIIRFDGKCRGKGVGDTVYIQTDDGSHLLMDYDGNVVLESDMEIEEYHSCSSEKFNILVRYDKRNKIHYCELYDREWDKIKNVAESEQNESIYTYTGEYQGEIRYVIADNRVVIIYDSDFNELHRIPYLYPNTSGLGNYYPNVKDNIITMYDYTYKSLSKRRYDLDGNFLGYK